MSDKKTIAETIEMWFSKKNIPLKVVEDTNKVRIGALIAFKAATPVGTIEKFEDVKTVGGLMIVVEPALEPGAACVSVVEGVAEALPPDTYELEDGRKFIVVEPGIIDSVEEKPADTPPAGDPPVEDVELKDTQNTVKQLTKRIEEITQYNADQKKVSDARYAALEQKYTAVIDGLDAFKTDTKEMLEEVFSEEGHDPKVTPKNPLKKGDAKPKKNVFLRSTQE